MKKLLVSIALLTGLASALPETIEFDVIIRDFQPNHPDFENFDDRSRHITASPWPGTGYAGFFSTCYGKNNQPTDLTAPLAQGGYSPSQSACEDGFPCGTPPLGRPQAFYGVYRNLTACPGFSVAQAQIYGYNGGDFKGHRHIAQRICGGPITTPASVYWEDPVFVTRGMVADELVKPNPLDPLTWYPVRNPNVNPMASCHSDLFDQWYQDVPNVNLRVNDIMTLNLYPGTQTYFIDSRLMPGSSYFPLDKYEGDAANPTFGRQGLNLWCPPYGVLNPCTGFNTWECSGGPGEAGPAGSSENQICQALLGVGGPREPTAAQTVAANIPGAAALLHNYAFTVMGHAKFTYNPTDTFSFSGDDDMWIFIDGWLVADLGGTHLPAEARLPMIDFANQLGWAPRSKHDLHFFYADRQTNSSNLRITTTLAELVPTTFGQPRILKAERSGEQLLISLNVQLHDESVAQIGMGTPGSGYFPILGIKYVVPMGQTEAVADTFGLVVNGFRFLRQDPQSGNYVYEIDGFFCSKEGLASGCLVANQIPSAGDSLAFNFYELDTDHSFEPTADMPPIKSKKNAGVNAWNWGLIGASTLTQVETIIVPVNKNPNSPPLDIGTLVGPPGSSFTAIGNGPTTGAPITYSPLGSAGAILPKERTGEVLLSLYPSDPEAMTTDAKKDLYRNGFGLPNIMNGNLPTASGYVATGTQLVGSTPIERYMVGAHKGDSPDAVHIAHCEVKPSSNPALEIPFDNNCLAVVMDADGPFQANVMMYDHLGNFVTRYQANVTADQVSALQNTQLASSTDGSTTTCANTNSRAVKTGKFRAAINVYPLSQMGRKIATGVYILKVDIIEKPYEYCLGEVRSASIFASPQIKLFKRTFNQVKVPYMRTGNK